MQTHLKYRDHSVNQKYCDYIQPLNQNVFDVIESRLKSIGRTLENSQILDFGCNVAHLLTTSEGRIKPKSYTGLDINRRALMFAEQLHPLARFYHYDRYNNTFNPEGSRHIDLPLGDERFDVIVAYGVFTHFFFGDIRKTVDELKRYLRPDGLIIFSVWEDGDYYGYLDFLRQRLGIELLLPRPSGVSKSMVLINRSYLLIDVEDSPEERFDWIETFLNPKFLCSELGAIKLLGTPTKHPVYYIGI